MQAKRKIAVAGATGRVGHHVVEVLTERGHEVVPMRPDVRRVADDDPVIGYGYRRSGAGGAALGDALRPTH
jgi:uncharacterized protein YbjT (DUF2867 family)